MLGIKRLYVFMLGCFLPRFVMTFVICLFIVLMQFLWRYIDDLVGKGLSIDVLGELFFYAALTMIPMALPLAVLLASLMTFGNLGENFELTAMKASGVSLLRVMSPLTAAMVAIAIGAFFFQNNVLPVAQTKMWTLLFSVRQKSPELEIPEGVFYDQIPGFNIFVGEKDRVTGSLHRVMIYDMSKGFDNGRVILADSGRLSSTADNAHLFLQLWSGEMFENLHEAGLASTAVPYRRESFAEKELLVKFDANFNRLDEEGMRNQYVGKNIAELQSTIDSVGARVDSLGRIYGNEILGRQYMGVGETRTRVVKGELVTEPAPDVAMDRPVDVDSVFRGRRSGSAAGYLALAINKAKRSRQEYEFKSLSIADDRKTLRRHSIELVKKFTLSMACIIFFFIGAPLGAIIRKGGLGTPLVISVLLFIVYYIIDNTGYKLARDGKWAVWEGMWLSSAILLPLGVFFTWKAVNDSAVFTPDAYVNFFRRLVGTHQTRNIAMKEVVIDEVDPAGALAMLRRVETLADDFLASDKGSMTFRGYWLDGMQPETVSRLSEALEQTVEYLSNSRDRRVINRMLDYPVMRRLWVYHPSRSRRLSYVMMALAPLSVPVYLWARRYHRRLVDEVETIAATTRALEALIENPDNPEN